jgi:hypothetical protein
VRPPVGHAIHTSPNRLLLRNDNNPPKLTVQAQYFPQLFTMTERMKAGERN